MADTKITSLQPPQVGYPVVPATDVLPIVVIADPGMATSGSTRKVTVNQLLGAGGTATLASATITGDLTVDTSTLYVSSSTDKVGIGTTSLSGEKLTVAGNISANAWLGRGNIAAPSGDCSIFRSADNTLGFGIASTTAMTLNSTGLGVGVASPNRKLHIGGTGNQVLRVETITSGDPSINLLASGINDCSIVYDRTNNYMRFDVSAVTGAMILGPTGNVGIGVAPITSHILSCAGPVGITGTIAGTRTSYITNASAASIYYTDGGGSGYFTDFGNLIIQPRTSAARSVVIATGSTTPVERAVVKSTGQVRFVPLAADPSGAEAGDVYYNSVSNRLKYYNGTAWTLI